MAKAKPTGSYNAPKRGRPAISPEARENQMIALSMDLVEQRLRDGTASSQETTHFLKLGSSKAILERDKLIEENKLLRAKTEQIHSMKNQEELLEKALRAFTVYKGQGEPDDYED